MLEHDFVVKRVTHEHHHNHHGRHILATLVGLALIDGDVHKLPTNCARLL